MVTTVAPTMPVDAAISAPTMNTETPSPPRMVPNIWPIVSSSSSATLDRSSVTPMKTNSGTANSTSFQIAVPKIRIGTADRKEKSKMPKAQATPAVPSPTPARVKATGKPASSARQAMPNISRLRVSGDMAMRPDCRCRRYHPMRE